MTLVISTKFRTRWNRFLGESESSRLIWKPLSTTALGFEAAQKVLRLVEVLEENDDVQTVTANFDIPERRDGTVDGLRPEISRPGAFRLGSDVHPAQGIDLPPI